jgi:hypothetical protein
MQKKKVLIGLKSGKTGIELSREMFRSQKTISTHKRKIMFKLGVKNDLQLRKAIQLQPPPDAAAVLTSGNFILVLFVRYNDLC